MFEDAYEEEEEKLPPGEAELRSTCFRVNIKCCEQCLLGPPPLVSEARNTQILSDCGDNPAGDYRHAFFFCHKGIEGEEKIICRAFYEQYKDRNVYLCLAQELERQRPGSLRFVAPTKKKT